jgi:hypothetical protein
MGGQTVLQLNDELVEEEKEEEQLEQQLHEEDHKKTSNPERTKKVLGSSWWKQITLLATHHLLVARINLGRRRRRLLPDG